MFIILRTILIEINMGKKLWQKDNVKLHPLVEKFTVGDDYVFDIELMPYDIAASMAHAKGLEKIKVLSKAELKQIELGLKYLKKDWEKGNIKITVADEDCHTVIENYLIKKIGIAGKKIHAGRSRNDQVLTAIRLYMLDKGKKIRDACSNLARIILSVARKNEFVPMPGYSHTRQAMLTSVGHYFASFAESLRDDALLLEAVENYISKSPLGSAAGFGVALSLPRAWVARELGFESVQVNSLYCQNSRGKFESIFMETLAQIMMTLGKLANDLIYFTAGEFGYFMLDNELTTGSSIMPQKKNPDALEILRGNVSVVFANQLMIKNLAKNLLSGYNRDLQLIKKPLFESVKSVNNSLEIAALFVQKIKINRAEIKEKISHDIFMADIATDLVKRGMPFREAYRKVHKMVVRQKVDCLKILKKRISLGAPGNMDLK